MQTPTPSWTLPGSGDRARKAVASQDEKRERILRSAEELFARQGYANTTMDQIVATLGMTKPFVYYYFRNKQEIFETLSWRAGVDCFCCMDFAEDDDRPAHAKVAQGLERLVRATLMHYPSAFFFYREPQVFRPEYHAAHKEVANHFYKSLCALLERGKAEGTLAFGETKITALAACSLSGFLFTWYRPDGRLSRDEIVAELTQLSLRMIGLQVQPDAALPARAARLARPARVARGARPA
jgi:AcrR family transcriptional regulator